MQERSALIYSTLACLFLGTLGVSFGYFTGAQAILLDGAFNIIYFFTSLAALRVATLIKRGDSQHWPLGFACLEPTVNLLKGCLIFGVSTMALLDAIGALFTGGPCRIEFRLSFMAVSPPPPAGQWHLSCARPVKSTAPSLPLTRSTGWSMRP